MATVKNKPKTKTQRAEELAQRKQREFHDRIDSLVLKYSAAKDWAMVHSLLTTIELLMERGEI